MVAIAAITLLGSNGILLAASLEPSPTESILEDGSGSAWISWMSLIIAPISIFVLWRTRGWRLRNVAGGPLVSPWRLPPVASLGMFGLGILGGGLAVLMIPPSWIPPTTAPLRSTAVVGWAANIGTLLACIPALLIARELPSPNDATPAVPMGRGILMGIFGFLIALPLIETGAILGQYVQQWISPSEPNLIAHELLDALVSVTPDIWWWMVAANAVIGAPVLEEILYRGFLQQAFRRAGVGPWPAILLTGSIFALMHYAVLAPDTAISAMTALLVLAIALGMIRERTGLIAPCIIAHGMFNALNLGLALLIT
ncbi:MAG: CPBP family intramembrane metalloprotease [Phycisphaerales bacterium]|jgi:membrane protease YdiL (CAAX protease family)|nr:CPBP family intramembrane metalloprotease [Phycisphaerales bacterium]